MSHRTRLKAAARRHRFIRQQEDEGLASVPRVIPPGLERAACEPFVRPLGGTVVNLSHDELTLLVAPEGPLAGAVLLANVHSTVMESRPLGIKPSRLYTWRPSFFFLREGESLRVASYKDHGALVVFPVVGDMDRLVTEQLAALRVDSDGLPLDPMEGMPPPPVVSSRWVP